MKLALFGANCMAGTQISKKALMRGHNLTAIVRDPARYSVSGDSLKVVVGNVLAPANITEIVTSYEVVISAAGAANATANNSDLAPSIVQAAHALIEGLNRVGVRRLVVVGGTDSLFFAPGV